jgi:hypothetical protein
MPSFAYTKSFNLRKNGGLRSPVERRGLMVFKGQQWPLYEYQP